MLNIKKYEDIFKYKAKPYSYDLLDKKKIEKIEKIKEISSLDSWVDMSDYDLIDDLKILAIKLKEINKFNYDAVLYRGLLEKFSMSASLNLNNPQLNHSYHYSSDKEAVSFTKDIKIARAFGNIIIETSFNNKTSFLDITPEIYFILSKRRNLKKLEVQDEVILLPPFNIDFKVVEINKKTLFETLSEL